MEEVNWTHPLWKQTIAGTQSTAIAQRNSAGGCFRLIFDDFIIPLIIDKHFEPVHQIWVAANEVADLVHEHISVYEVLGKQIAELQEFVHGGLVRNVFLDTIEECKLFRGSS
jgi:hypothetical protein